MAKKIKLNHNIKATPEIEPIILSAEKKVEQYKEYVKSLSIKRHGLENMLKNRKHNLGSVQIADLKIQIFRLDTEIEAKTKFWQHYLGKMMREAEKADSKEQKKVSKKCNQ